MATKAKSNKIVDLRDQVKTQLDELVDRIESEYKRLEKQARKSPTYIKAKKSLRDLDKQVATLQTNVVNMFGLASKAELDKLNKKLSSLSRKVNGKIAA